MSHVWVGVHVGVGVEIACTYIEIVCTQVCRRGMLLFFCIRIARVTNFVGVHKCDNLCMYKNVIIGMCVNV